MFHVHAPCYMFLLVCKSDCLRFGSRIQQLRQRHLFVTMLSALQKDVVTDNEITAERHNVKFIIDVSLEAILIEDSLQMQHTTDVRLSLFRVFRKVLEVAAVCDV